MDELGTIYNKYYLKTREDGAITDAWSDGPHRDRDTDGAVCFNERGGYQLRLAVDGVETEENPVMWTRDGVPLYKYVDGEVKRRSEAEIEADRSKLPPAAPSPLEQLRADLDFVMIMTDLM